MNRMFPRSYQKVERVYSILKLKIQDINFKIIFKMLSEYDLGSPSLYSKKKINKNPNKYEKHHSIKVFFSLLHNNYDN